MNDATPFDLQQEAQYVLGLMDIYKRDFEIENILKRKGLTDMEIVEVMHFVRKKFMQKRMRQGRNIMWLGIGVAVATGAAWMYLTGLWERNLDLESFVDFLLQDSSLGESILNTILGYGFIFGVLQAIFGASRYVIYFKKSNS